MNLRCIYNAAMLYMFFLLVSCGGEEKSVPAAIERVPVISVGDEALYKEDIDQLFSSGKVLGDSAKYVEEYLVSWAQERMLYKVARRNVRQDERMEKMVEEYRRSLLLNSYQQQLLAQKLESEISDEQLQEFYEDNKHLFKAEETLIRGVFIKVPYDSPDVKKLRGWCEDDSIEARDNLEKYSITNALSFDTFIEEWRVLSMYAAKMPVTQESLRNSVKKQRTFEYKDSTGVYMLSVRDIIAEGELLPYDAAKYDVKGLMINSIKAAFWEEVKENLYRDGLASGEIKRNN